MKKLIFGLHRRYSQIQIQEHRDAFSMTHTRDGLPIGVGAAEGNTGPVDGMACWPKCPHL